MHQQWADDAFTARYSPWGRKVVPFYNQTRKFRPEMYWCLWDGPSCIGPGCLLFESVGREKGSLKQITLEQITTYSLEFWLVLGGIAFKLFYLDQTF